MLNNFTIIVQNVVKIFLEIDGVIIKFLVLKNRNFHHCSTCVILLVNTLCRSDIILNKTHGTFD